MNATPSNFGVQRMRRSASLCVAGVVPARADAER